MQSESFGKITKITGSKVTILVQYSDAVNKVSVDNFVLNYISIGALLGTKLVDGRTLVLTVEEIYEHDMEHFISASISGIFDSVLQKFTFGTNSYPLIGEQITTLSNDVLSSIFAPRKERGKATIGTYIYDSTVPVGYDPDVLFGKHLGVYGNTGSGKTCTVVSIIQNYIRENPEKDIKFIILDVNGEYRTAFNESEYEYYEFGNLRFNHTILNNVEYGRLFRAAEGIQYPALRDCIHKLADIKNEWNMEDLEGALTQWIDEHTPENQYGKKDLFHSNNLGSNLRPMLLRIESITSDKPLMSVINSSGMNTLEKIIGSDKKVHILDLQVSIDTLDIVLYLLFKTIYQYKVEQRKEEDPDPTHLNLVLEEAHRYINVDINETKLGNYYIDKLSREGRKFGIGLVISSQVPSMLSYEIVSQCNSVIMHKITSKRDMEFLRGVLRISNDAFYLQMSALEKQHAIVCGEAFPNDSIVKILDANPLPMSNDPVIGDITLLKTAPSDYCEEERNGCCSIDLSEVDISEELYNPDDWDDSIKELLKSTGSATALSLIRRLSDNKYWTAYQIENLCEAAVENSHLAEIFWEPDVLHFYKQLLNGLEITDGFVKVVHDMIKDAEQEARGNDWKENEAGI